MEVYSDGRLRLYNHFKKPEKGKGLNAPFKLFYPLQYIENLDQINPE